jgi:hypothetical protein
MKTIDVTLLFPEYDEVTMCYRLGLKSMQIDGCAFPVFSVRSDKKDVFLERLKDEFGKEVNIEDVGKIVDAAGGNINVVYNSNFLKREQL